jgi:hypothetical protein
MVELSHPNHGRNYIAHNFGGSNHIAQNKSAPAIANWN